MYQALYRKYRPDNFNDVVGQYTIVDTLKNAVANNRISHAYLFTGPRGTGKTSIAKILAKTINCKDLVDLTPCCKCVSCTQIEHKQSTDIIEIDAASNNGVDEIREIRNKVNLVPSTGKYKVYIIDEVHMLTSGAFNALLKTLEEPPAHVIFILATTEPHKIPSTILSRCQRFDFRKLLNNDVLSRLELIAERENINISQEAMIEITNKSDGCLRDAINLLDQVCSYQNEKITIEDINKINGSLSETRKKEFIDAIIEKNLILILKLIDDYNSEGKNLIKILEEITITLKNMLIYKISPKVLENKTENMEIYKNTVDKINIDEIIELLEKINATLNNIKQANDPKLAIELLMIKQCSNVTSIEKNSVETKNVTKVIPNSIQVEENTISINQTQKEQKVIEKKDSNSNLNDLLEKFKERRIENTLARFDKKILKATKEKLKEVEEYIVDEKFTKIASLIMDGELKATSNEYLLFVYDTEGAVNQFNINTNEIERFLSKKISLQYKVVSTSNISWEIIKKEFNAKERAYIYVPDDIDLSNLKNQKKDKSKELQEFFGNIIEYE